MDKKIREQIKQLARDTMIGICDLGVVCHKCENELPKQTNLYSFMRTSIGIILNTGQLVIHCERHGENIAIFCLDELTLKELKPFVGSK